MPPSKNEGSWLGEVQGIIVKAVKFNRLSRTTITDKGLGYLLKMPLKSLGLHRTKITNKEINLLGNLRVSDLDISNTRIDKDCLEILKCMPLNYLNLAGAGNIIGIGSFPYESLHALRRALPNCKIIKPNGTELEPVEKLKEGRRYKSSKK